jgi:hypothetical protein
MHRTQSNRLQDRQKGLCPIDLNGNYPCPCRCRGHLIPIALMDAMGCERCQQIFVLSDDAETIERVAPHYPSRQRWYWDGSQWLRTRRSLGDRYLSITIGYMAIVAVVWLLLATQRHFGVSPVILVVFCPILMIVPAILARMLFRR